MKAIFYIVAILAILASSWFSYSSLGKIKKQADFVQSQRQNLKNIKAELSEVKGEDDQLNKTLENAKKERAELEESLKIAESKSRQRTQRISKIEGRIADLDERLEEIKERKIEAGAGAGDIPLDSIPDRIKEIKREVSSDQERISELETLITGAESKVDTLKEEVSRLQKSRQARSNRISTNSREAVVTAVNNRWGFAVLNLGKNQGFEPTSDLLVKRGSRLIGRLKVASVEPSQTIANFDRNSIEVGVRIRPGDRVIVQVPATR